MLPQRIKILILFLFISTAWAEEPPAIYLTWEHNPSTTITVAWLTPKKLDLRTVEYQKEGETSWKKGEMSRQAPMPEQYDFMIHHLEITGLQADTKYSFRFTPEGQVYAFRTLPDHPKAPYKFAVGGDIYHDTYDLVVKMNKQVAKLDPQFIILGGDLAYSSSKRPSLKPDVQPRWVDLAASWKDTFISPNGLMIPILTVIGNHDVKGAFGQTPAEAPFFYQLFPTSGYAAFDIDRVISIFMLDSGHTHPITGKQTRWLEEALQARKDIPFKFVVYHIAAYPSVRQFDGQEQKQIRKYWSPLFEKYGVKAVFEHHDHAYKRTHPIRNNRVDPTGVIYMGDGGWGVEKLREPHNPKKTWYLAKALAKRNINFVKVHDGKVDITAYDDDGNILDEVTVK